jgi:hypothetical protein
MKRAIVVALGVAVVASSAAGFGIGAASRSAPPLVQCAQSDGSDVCRLRVAAAARTELRARLEARYEADRAKCAALGGAQKDACLIAAHAARGRSLLEAAAPYERRG